MTFRIKDDDVGVKFVAFVPHFTGLEVKPSGTVAYDKAAQGGFTTHLAPARGDWVGEFVIAPDEDLFHTMELQGIAGGEYHEVSAIAPVGSPVPPLIAFRMGHAGSDTRSPWKDK